MIAFCIDCDSSREITVHGQCLACGSYAICYRRVEITKHLTRANESWFTILKVVNGIQQVESDDCKMLSSLQRDGVMGEP